MVGGGLELEVDQYSPPLEAEAAGDFWDTIAAVMARHEPETTAEGATHARALSQSQGTHKQKL